jgi:hypothetical protein
VLVAGCRVVVHDHAIDRPRIATSQVKGHHPILVIRRTPNTVNAHIRSIYAKLGVGDRSSAVRRARELRLLAAAGRTR